MRTLNHHFRNQINLSRVWCDVCGVMCVVCCRVVRVWFAVFVFLGYPFVRVNGFPDFFTFVLFPFKNFVLISFMNFSTISPFLQGGPMKEFENSKIQNSDREPSLITENAKLKYVQRPVVRLLCGQRRYQITFYLQY